MSFDAKQTDGAGAAVLSDDGLPEDLAALGQQLCDDAARLTKAYPADAQRRTRDVRRRSFWRSATVLRWGALAASLLMLIGGGSLWIAGQLGEVPVGGGSVASTPSGEGNEPNTPATPNTSHVVSVPIHPVVSIDRPQTFDLRERLTAEDVLKMTGPKLDAYGDIRADESEAMESFSF